MKRKFFLFVYVRAEGEKRSFLIRHMYFNYGPEFYRELVEKVPELRFTAEEFVWFVEDFICIEI